MSCWDSGHLTAAHSTCFLFRLPLETRHHAKHGNTLTYIRRSTDPKSKLWTSPKGPRARPATPTFSYILDGVFVRVCFVIKRWLRLYVRSSHLTTLRASNIGPNIWTDFSSKTIRQIAYRLVGLLSNLTFCKRKTANSPFAVSGLHHAT